MRKPDVKRIVQIGSGAVALALALHCGGGGIGGTGSVSGFGSVWVNGIEWFTEGAEITLDGVPASEADLRIGMVVDLDGTPLSATTAVASRVAFDDAIQGPVASLSAPSAGVRELGILGQTVFLRQGVTHFDDSDPGFGFTSVALDDVLEVSGHVDGDGAIHATWVRRLGTLALGQTEVELEGAVSILYGSSFQIGPVLVMVGPGTDLSGLEEDLAVGLPVEVEGVLVAGRAVQATRVADVDALPTEIAEYSLEGLVSDFVSLADFRVAGQPVDASGAELIPPDPGFLAEGALVEVEGPIVDGVLVAGEVALEAPDAQIRAPLASLADVDPATGTLVLLGAEVRLAPDASVEDERDHLPGFGLADLAAGDFVRVQGVDDQGVLVAEELHRLDPGNVVVRGPVTSFDAAASRVEVCHVPFGIDASTRLSAADGSALSAAELFGALRVGAGLKVVDAPDPSDPWRVADEVGLTN